MTYVYLSQKFGRLRLSFFLLVICPNLFFLRENAIFSLSTAFKMRFTLGGGHGRGTTVHLLLNLCPSHTPRGSLPLRVIFYGTPVPIKFPKIAAMLVPMHVTDALRTEGASTSRVHGFSSHASFRLCILPPYLRNSVVPNCLTSYVVLRTCPPPRLPAVESSPSTKSFIFSGQMWIFSSGWKKVLDMGREGC